MTRGESACCKSAAEAGTDAGDEESLGLCHGASQGCWSQLYHDIVNAWLVTRPLFNESCLYANACWTQPSACLHREAQPSQCGSLRTKRRSAVRPRAINSAERARSCWR